jgi:hypothetical protein
VQFARVNSKTIVAVFSLDVGMILDIGKDVEPTPYACLCEILGDGVYPTALRAADHPS